MWNSTKTHSVQEHIIYNAIRGLPLNRGFSPITNENKIVSNGNDPMFAFNKALNYIQVAMSLAKEDGHYWQGRYLAEVMKWEELFEVKLTQDMFNHA